MAKLSFRGIHKIYPGGFHAVKDFQLEIADGEFIVFVGPSGCGKSTTLRMAAGLEEISSGDLLIDGERVNEVEPKERNIAMVFQNYALYPHMTVRDNMSYALKIKKLPKAERDRKVREAARILGLEQLLDRKPKELSGGQRQRVALGRAIVRNPKVFLMDEPLSNLDAKLRVQMRMEIVKLHEQLGTTFIYVTHDQTEAMTMGDRIVVMDGGVIQQVGRPEDVYFHPKNLFVAGFIGSPQMNLFAASSQGTGTLNTAFGPYALMEDQQALVKKAQSPDKLLLGIRPEHLTMTEPKGASLKIRTKVDWLELLGSEKHLHCQIEETPFLARVPSDEEVKRGDTISLYAPAEKMHLFDAESEANLAEVEEDGNHDPDL